MIVKLLKKINLFLIRWQQDIWALGNDVEEWKQKRKDKKKAKNNEQIIDASYRDIEQNKQDQ